MMERERSTATAAAGHQEQRSERSRAIAAATVGESKDFHHGLDFSAVHRVPPDEGTPVALNAAARNRHPQLAFINKSCAGLFSGSYIFPTTKQIMCGSVYMMVVQPSRVETTNRETSDWPMWSKL